ncbi:MAG: hypothetical protein H6765_03175 [Candidatus Peribacteria bacterium]|nr:MAG: hypothetical protein H6765_03175 [Candidatus Peribacteria bacterium]
MASLVLFIVFAVTVYHKDPMMFVGMCVMMVLAAAWYEFFGSKQFVWRMKAKSAAVELQRTQVRWFMNKFEIVQQGKTQEELEKRYEINGRWYAAKRQEKCWQ